MMSRLRLGMGRCPQRVPRLPWDIFGKKKRGLGLGQGITKPGGARVKPSNWNPGETVQLTSV